MTHNILYSFRRCPYAMRARLALAQSRIEVELREIILRDKPSQMLEISPKGTVPVLRLADGRVLEESLDIMHHALSNADPGQWLMDKHQTQSNDLIHINDGIFKYHLDRYKYPSRYNNEDGDQTTHRQAAFQFIEAYEARLVDRAWLLDENPRFADMAILPFVRQFANTDRAWFNAQPIPHVHNWLARFLKSALFESTMHKYPRWTPDEDPTLLHVIPPAHLIK